MKAQEYLDALKRKYTKTTDYSMLTQKYDLSEVELQKRSEELGDKYKQLLVEPLYDYLATEQITTPSRTRIEFLPVPQINASAIAADDNEYLVIINERLLASIFSWNELTFIRAKKLDSGETSSENYAKNFAALVDCYLTPTSGKTLPVFSFDEITQEECSLVFLKTIMNEQFVLAHELAHIYLKHLKPGSSSSYMDDSISFYWEASDNQQKEFDADVQAMEWLLGMAEKSLDKNPLYHNPLLFAEVLVYMHLLECNTGFPTSKSKHPSALSRILHIKEKLGQYFENADYSIEDMISNCKDIESFKIR